MLIKLKRAYEKTDPEDGTRILIDRLWPRGLRKENAKLDSWLKDIAPSNELRKWYSHDPAKWTQFKERYWKELYVKQDIVSALAQQSERNTITLVFSSKEEKLNNAAALKQYIEHKFKL